MEFLVHVFKPGMWYWIDFLSTVKYIFRYHKMQTLQKHHKTKKHHLQHKSVTTSNPSVQMEHRQNNKLQRKLANSVYANQKHQKINVDKYHNQQLCTIYKKREIHKHIISITDINATLTRTAHSHLRQNTKLTCWHSLCYDNIITHLCALIHWQNKVISMNNGKMSPRPISSTQRNLRRLQEHHSSFVPPCTASLLRTWWFTDFLNL